MIGERKGTMVNAATRQRTRPTAAVIALVLALVTGGCTERTDAPEPDRPSEPATIQEALFVGEDYSYPIVPEHLRAGAVRVTFENRGDVFHKLTLTGIGDASLAEFIEDGGPTIALTGKPFPSYIDQVAVPPFVGIEGGKVGHATYTLTEGRYALYCNATNVPKGEEEAPHFEMGMIRLLTVEGGEAEPELPPADGTITATDYAFDVDLEAGDRTVNFVNEGPDQVHLTTIEMYPEGVTEAQARKDFEGKGALASHTNGLGFGGIFSAGLGAQIVLPEDAIQSGRTYLFVCFVPDREGGEAHVTAYGMYEIVTIE
jgi:hypothetical protein